MEDNRDALLDWDTVLDDDGKASGQTYTILPEGDYNFTVTEMVRKEHPGSAKMPACKKATLTIEIDSDNGVGRCFVDLFLVKKVEWKITSFFRCVGLRKSGDKAAPKWDKAIGSKGRAHFKPDEYTTSDGTKKSRNNLDYFIDYDEWHKDPAQNDEGLPF